MNSLLWGQVSNLIRKLLVSSIIVGLLLDKLHVLSGRVIMCYVRYLFGKTLEWCSLAVCIVSSDSMTAKECPSQFQVTFSMYRNPNVVCLPNRALPSKVDNHEWGCCVIF